MRLRLGLAAAVLILSPLGAYADTLSTFDFNAVLDPNTGTGGSVSGNIVLDVTNGTFFSSSLTSTYGSKTYNVSSTETTQATKNGSLVVLTFGSIGDSPDAFLSLVLPTTTLVNYGGGGICSDVSRCSEANNSNYSSSYFAPYVQAGDGLTSGALTLHVVPVPPTPVGTTPEPSSLVMLGTGALGILGAARRRLQRA